MKTILIRPNAKKKQYGSTMPLSAIEPPIWLTLYANLVENPIVLDAEVENLSLEEIDKKVKEIKPDKIIIFATGNHPSAYVQQKDSAYGLACRFLDNKPEVYDHLPFNPITDVKGKKPRWDLLPMDKYRAHNWHCWGGLKRQPYGVIFSSISCPFRCDFCCIHNFYQTKYQIRDANEVVRDVYDLYENYGVTNFKVMDELFVTKGHKVLDICKELFPIGDKINIWAYARIDLIDSMLLEYLRKAGVRWLAYGIESGNEKIRKDVLKGTFTNKQIKDVIEMTKSCDINIIGNYMFGFWEDNFKTMRETLKLAIELNCEYSNFYCVVAYPETPLYNRMDAIGVRLPTKSSQYAQLSPDFLPLPTATLSREEVLKFRDAAFTRYHTTDRYLPMMSKKFGNRTVDEIMSMIDRPLQRNLLK